MEDVAQSLEYCSQRKQYRLSYEAKLKGNETIANETVLQNLEIKLDLSTLIEIREAVKLKIRQKPTENTGWFSGWFGSSSTTDEVIEISLEDKERLQSLIQNEYIISGSKNRPGVTKHSLNISMPLLSIECAELIAIEFHDSVIDFKSIPGSCSTSMELVTRNFEITNLRNKAEKVVTSRLDSRSNILRTSLNPIDKFLGS